MSDLNSVVTLIISQLERTETLSPAERGAIAALPIRLRNFDASSYIIREGDRPERCSIVVMGYAFRQRLTTSGARQILAFHMPGDFVDLQSLYLAETDYNVQTLTRATIADMAATDLSAAADRYPRIARSVAMLNLLDAAICRDWLMNVGRREALSRVAHLLCELAHRSAGKALTDGAQYELPMTQEQLADALGLTAVHVNRVLKKLQNDGLISRSKRHIGILTWDALCDVGDFSARYLHFAQAGGVDRVTEGNPSR